MPLFSWGSASSAPAAASEAQTSGVQSRNETGEQPEYTLAISSASSVSTTGSAGTTFESCLGGDEVDDELVLDVVEDDASNSVAEAAPPPPPESILSSRQGTISSARFNIWSTMVGGGSLSLPLAFGKTGNAFLAPLIVISVACITEFCFRVLLDAARTSNQGDRNDFAATPTPQTIRSTNPLSTISPLPSQSRSQTRAAQEEQLQQQQQQAGTDSLENICAAAFGSTAYVISTLLVFFMCFFGIVGYCVLLRDMLEPATKFVWSSALDHNYHQNQSNYTTVAISLSDNLSMWTVVVLVTPLCTLQTLTSLQHVGAASMCAVFLLGVTIVYRSVQCATGRIPHHQGLDKSHWTDGFRMFPESWHDVLDVAPLFISCYVCHYNIPVVYNDLQDPTPARVRWWLRSTVWGSTAFYLIMGVAGSLYATVCSDTLHGNILLDFPAHDPLILMGRLCLALTIALAFPVLTLPARDILLRAVMNSDTFETRPRMRRRVINSQLTEPLLNADLHDEITTAVGPSEPSSPMLSPPSTSADDSEMHLESTCIETTDTIEHSSSNSACVTPRRPPSLLARLLASVAVLWTGTALASCVASIDVVWDLLGSSLSILLSFLIPCGSFLVMSQYKADHRVATFRCKLSRGVCWLLILLFVPLMFISTANAIHNTFFRK